MERFIGILITCILPPLFSILFNFHAPANMGRAFPSTISSSSSPPPFSTPTADEIAVSIASSIPPIPNGTIAGGSLLEDSLDGVRLNSTMASDVTISIAHWASLLLLVALLTIIWSLTLWCRRGTSQRTPDVDPSTPDFNMDEMIDAIVTRASAPLKEAFDVDEMINTIVTRASTPLKEAFTAEVATIRNEIAELTTQNETENPITRAELEHRFDLLKKQMKTTNDVAKDTALSVSYIRGNPIRLFERYSNLLDKSLQGISAATITADVKAAMRQEMDEMKAAAMEKEKKQDGLMNKFNRAIDRLEEQGSVQTALRTSLETKIAGQQQQDSDEKGQLMSRIELLERRSAGYKTAHEGLDMKLASVAQQALDETAARRGLETKIAFLAQQGSEEKAARESLETKIVLLQQLLSDEKAAHEHLETKIAALEKKNSHKRVARKSLEMKIAQLEKDRLEHKPMQPLTASTTSDDLLTMKRAEAAREARLETIEQRMTLSEESVQATNERMTTFDISPSLKPLEDKLADLRTEVEKECRQFAHEVKKRMDSFDISPFLKPVQNELASLEGHLNVLGQQFEERSHKTNDTHIEIHKAAQEITARVNNIEVGARQMSEMMADKLWVTENFLMLNVGGADIFDAPVQSDFAPNGFTDDAFADGFDANGAPKLPEFSGSIDMSGLELGESYQLTSQTPEETGRVGEPDAAIVPYEGQTTEPMDEPAVAAVADDHMEESAARAVPDETQSSALAVVVAAPMLPSPVAPSMSPLEEAPASDPPISGPDAAVAEPTAASPPPPNDYYNDDDGDDSDDSFDKEWAERLANLARFEGGPPPYIPIRDTNPSSSEAVPPSEKTSSDPAAAAATPSETPAPPVPGRKILKPRSRRPAASSQPAGSALAPEEDEAIGSDGERAALEELDASEEESEEE